MRGTVFKCWIKRVPVALLNLCPHNNGLCCWELFESHLKGHSSSNPSFIPPWPGLAQLIRLLLLQDLLETWVEGWQRIGNWRRPLLKALWDPSVSMLERTIAESALKIKPPEWLLEYHDMPRSTVRVVDPQGPKSTAIWEHQQHGKRTRRSSPVN